MEINGHHGIIERFTLRGIRLRDEAGRAHVLSNRDITNVIVHQRREESAVGDPLSMDSGRQPATSGQRPAAGGQQPTASGQQAAAGKR